MNYRDYYESVKDVKIPGTLEFELAGVCLHPSRLPLRLASLCGCDNRVVRVPQFAGNKFGAIVPVTGIKRDVFSNNRSVTDIILPSSICAISKGAFSGCENLRNVTLSKSIKRIEEKTFDGCTNLENVYYEGTREEWRQTKIVYDRYEVDFGDMIPGSPVQEILDERKVFIPGNEALRMATIHFNCDLKLLDVNPVDDAKAHQKTIRYEIFDE